MGAKQRLFLIFSIATSKDEYATLAAPELRRETASVPLALLQAEHVGVHTLKINQKIVAVAVPNSVL